MALNYPATQLGGSVGPSRPTGWFAPASHLFGVLGPELLVFPVSSCFEVDLLGYLNSRASLTFHPGHLPQGATLPACSFFMVSEDPKYTLRSAAGLTARIYQFDHWSTLYLDTVLFELRLRKVLHGFRGLMGSTFVSSCRIQDVMDMPYEPNVDDTDQGTYHRVSEYRILLKEIIPSF